MDEKMREEYEDLKQLRDNWVEGEHKSTIIAFVASTIFYFNKFRKILKQNKEKSNK